MATKISKSVRVSKGKALVANETKTPTVTKKVTKVNPKELDNKNIKDTVKQIVESEREIKYNYPKEIDNQLDRKAWRQKVRNQLRSMERAITKAEDGSKEKVKLEREYKAYRKEVLLVP